MCRILTAVLFAIAIFAAQSFVSAPQAQASWRIIDGGNGTLFSSPGPACQSLVSSRGQLIAIYPSAPPQGVAQPQVQVYVCEYKEQLLNVYNHVAPVCGSGDIGPNPNSTVLDGCSPIAPPDGRQLGDCGCGGNGNEQGNNGDGTQVGNPITINSGNKFEKVTDYESAGPNKLSFTRYYNSQSRSSSLIGFRWNSTFDRRLFVNTFADKDATVVTLQRSDGAVLIFNKTS